MYQWTIEYEDFVPREEKLREALCTLGNGYFATRGALESAVARDGHYPGTYLAGGYNRVKTEVAGSVIENEDLVNFPNWLYLTFRLRDGEWFDPPAVQLLSYRQQLDLKKGTLLRAFRIRDQQGRETTVASRRFVHMKDPHLAGIEMTLTAENWSGEIQIRSGLDGRVVNAGVERYEQLANEHLQLLSAGPLGEDAIVLLVRTNQSQLQVAQAARTQIFCNHEKVTAPVRTVKEQAFIAQESTVDVARGQTIAIEKIVSLFTSRDRAISECRLAAEQAIQRAGRFEQLLGIHTSTWEQIWARSDLVLDGEKRTQLLLRLHIFHLFQTVSPNTIDLDVGVPPRGWHGEAYRGHILWDELFVFPFLNLQVPQLTRALLLYRYRRLPQARWAAMSAGYRGAMFPWQSGSDGREESQLIHLNPESGRWIPDNSRLQRHVNAAIAYNVWQYYQATGDREFLSSYGAEMLLEIARFWASISTYNASIDRYEILGVMGPDEYHDAYPGADRPGLNNNAYSNVMAVWTLKVALQALELVAPDRRQALCHFLDLGEAELASWEERLRKMRIVFHGEGIISQFEGYHELEEFDWDRYKEKYGDIHRLDRILESEGDTPNRYKVSKQADVLMLFYLFSAEELGSLFGGLGYALEYETIPKNIEYYLRRAAHGSTLSRLVHAWVLARSDRLRSWQLFKEALESDLSDIQGGTTAEGIHLGAMAGTVDLMQRCYTGMVMRDEVLWLNPCLPESLDCLSFTIRYRNHWLEITVNHRELKVCAKTGWAQAAKVGFGEHVYQLEQGESRTFSLPELAV